MANLSLGQIKEQSIQAKLNPTFKPRYSIQTQLNLIFLNLGYRVKLGNFRDKLDLIRLNSS